MILCELWKYAFLEKKFIDWQVLKLTLKCLRATNLSCYEQESLIFHMSACTYLITVLLSCPLKLSFLQAVCPHCPKPYDFCLPLSQHVAVIKNRLGTSSILHVSLLYFLHIQSLSASNTFLLTEEGRFDNVFITPWLKVILPSIVSPYSVYGIFLSNHSKQCQPTCQAGMNEVKVHIWS